MKAFDNGSGYNYGSKIHRVKTRKAVLELLDRYQFTHFITLATNRMDVDDSIMRRLLKEWDARVNRDLVGPKWAKRPDERLMWYAFPEKLLGNPHWHLLAHVDNHVETATRAERQRRLPIYGLRHWRSLVPTGTFDCQPLDHAIEQGRLKWYVTKELPHPGMWERAIFHNSL